MTPIASEHTLQEASEKTRLLLAGLWKRNLPVIEERLTILGRAAAAHPMSDDLHAAARDVAHKFSGSLGMFGFEQGTVIAREMEQLLDTPYPDAPRLAALTKELRAMLLPAS